MQKILILLAIAALLLVTCGCTDSTPEVPVTTSTPVKTPLKTTIATPPPATTIPPQETAQTVNDNTISISRDGFSPATITVKKGATVRWVNMDTTDDPGFYNPTHRIKLGTIKTSPIISSGQGWSWVFTDTGVFDYTDLVHTDMRGTVVVE